MSKIAKPRNATTTRQSILHAAEIAFSSASYERVRLRDVAQAAGVDVALISRYFGSKAGLFEAVLGDQIVDLKKFASGPTEGFGERLADYLWSKDFSRADFDPLHVLVRSMGSPAALELFRRYFQEDALAPLVRLLGGRVTSKERAALVFALLVGYDVIRILSEDVRGSSAKQLFAGACQALVDE